MILDQDFIISKDEEEYLFDPDANDDFDWRYQYGQDESLEYYSAPNGWNNFFKVEDVIEGHSQYIKIEYQSDAYAFIVIVQNQYGGTHIIDMSIYRITDGQFDGEIKHVELRDTTLNVNTFLDVKNGQMLPSSEVKFVGRMQRILNNAAFF